MKPTSQMQARHSSVNAPDPATMTTELHSRLTQNKIFLSEISGCWSMYTITIYYPNCACVYVCKPCMCVFLCTGLHYMHAGMYVHPKSEIPFWLRPCPWLRTVLGVTLMQPVMTTIYLSVYSFIHSYCLF